VTITLEGSDLKRLFPISWILESQFVVDYLAKQIGEEASAEPFLIADFASGENDKIPNFIHRILPGMLTPDVSSRQRRVLTYSTDLHGLRLDSLFHMFQEEDILDQSRAVFARLESMVNEASFRQEQVDYLQENEVDQTELDKRLLEETGIGENAFHLGFLNNDVVGYLFEYYKAYTDAQSSLKTIHTTIRPGGVLIVTQPCSLYPVNNIEVLTSVGFSFVEGYDIDVKSGTIAPADEATDLKGLSRMGHYTFFVLRKA
jgi:hypothetical protein